MHFGIISKLNLQCNIYSSLFCKKLTLVLQTTSNPCGLFYNHCIGAPDWACRLNSYQASNWLYGFHPRVSNSHWLLFPNAVVIKSASFSWFVRKWDFFAKKWTARNRGAMGFVPKDENDMSVPITASHAARMRWGRILCREQEVLTKTARNSLISDMLPLK